MRAGSAHRVYRTLGRARDAAHYQKKPVSPFKLMPCPGAGSSNAALSGWGRTAGAGSDGLEYFLFESEFDLERESLRAWDSCPVKGGGNVTVNVCTDRISGTQLKVKVKVATFPQGAINVYAYPCYVISGTSNIQGCDPYNRGYYPNYSGDSYFSVSNSYGFVGGFRGWYSFGKRIR